MLLVMIRSVLCFTLSRDGRAGSDFGHQQTKQTKLYTRVNTISRTNVIRMADSVTKGNQQDGKLTQSEPCSHIQENNKR